MVKVKRSYMKKNSRGSKTLSSVRGMLSMLLQAGGAFLVISVVSSHFNGQSTPLSTFSSMSTPHYNYKVDEDCTNMVTIRPAGTYFLDSKVSSAKSYPGIDPPFNIGSNFGKQATKHMSADLVHFELIKDLVKGKEGGLTFGIGANQGFFTYYLAALGMEVHSFEISEKNFIALQHGSRFNPKAISEQINLYPVGLGEKNTRFGISGKDYGAFLSQDGATGPIQGASFDCFAYHTKLDISNVAFVKLDVEGFEIAVLKGAQNSLFREDSKNVGGMLMEVSPSRWNRAQVDFATGVAEMKKLSTHFENSYLLVRAAGGHAEGCPTALADKNLLSDKAPKIMTVDVSIVHMYKVKMDEWEPLLAEMDKNNYDCNFWYKN